MSDNNSNEKVLLNVGGSKFETLKSTLIKCDYFKALFDKKWNHDPKQEELFLDRDPESFAILLSFLRYNDYRVIPKDMVWKIESEFSYFGLPVQNALTQSGNLDSAVYYGSHIYIFGKEGSVYLSRRNADAVRGSKNDAVLLQIIHVSVIHGNKSIEDFEDTPLRYGDLFYLKTEDNNYFQRTKLMYDDSHWGTGRFSLGYSANPSQTVSLPYGKLGSPVLWDQWIGVTFAGTKGDGKAARLDPDNTDRRILTLRSSDEPSCIVNNWNGHEQIKFLRPE